MYEFLSWVASDYMTRNPLAVAPSATLGETGEIFATRNFNGLPVVDGAGYVVGFLTKLDWLKAFTFSPETIVPHYADIMRQPIERFMTRDIVAIHTATPLTRVLQRMVDTRHKSVPVLESGRLAGIIAREDIVRALETAAGKTPAGELSKSTK